MAAEMLDRDGQIRRGRVRAGLVEQRHGTFGESAEPGSVGQLPCAGFGFTNLDDCGRKSLAVVTIM